MLTEKEGILYQDGNPYVLAGSIIKMTQDTERTKLYAYEAHKRASIRHNKTNVINEILNGYNEIINDFHYCPIKVG